MTRSIISTENAPVPTAPLSQAVRKGSLLQVSGQLPFHPESGDVVGTTVAEQTAQVLRNITAVLEAAGASLEDVIMLRVYLTDPAHIGELNEAYGKFVGPTPPARTTVFMGLPKGLLVEIDALAVLED
jgi:reactive intermediate/imine deaminase